MLAAPNRLRRSDDFRRTVRDGRRSSRRTVVVHYLPGDGSDSPPARVGFVVSRSVGNAVARKRATRRLRHLLRERLDRLEPGSMLVVRAVPRAATATSADLAGDVDACLDRVTGRPSRAVATGGGPA